MSKADQFFHEKYGYRVFNKNSSLSQILQQGECDAIGVSLQDGFMKVYAVDVAFHENGLSYGSRQETVKLDTEGVIFVRDNPCWQTMKCGLQQSAGEKTTAFQAVMPRDDRTLVASARL